MKNYGKKATGIFRYLLKGTFIYSLRKVSEWFYLKIEEDLD
jgi:hypothetical protein